jgi:hypothetical protein
MTHFRRYRGRRVQFSCLALQDSISAVPRASGSVFMFCAPGLVFGDTDGVESRFYVLRSRTHFRRYRGRQVPFSSFTLPDPFFAVPTASVPVFLFCAPGPILGGTDGVGSRFHVLRSRMHFRRYRGRRVSFSSFALHDYFSTVPRASGLVFLFCAPGPIFDSTNDVGSRFHVLRSRTHFRRLCRVLDPFSFVPSSSGHVFMFCAPGLFSGGTEGVRSRFHVLRSRTRCQR